MSAVSDHAAHVSLMESAATCGCCSALGLPAFPQFADGGTKSVWMM